MSPVIQKVFIRFYQDVEEGVSTSKQSLNGDDCGLPFVEQSYTIPIFVGSVSSLIIA